MSYLIFNGWNIRFHPLFRQQWNDLLSDATKLRGRLSATEYVLRVAMLIFVTNTDVLHKI